MKIAISPALKLGLASCLVAVSSSIAAQYDPELVAPSKGLFDPAFAQYKQITRAGLTFTVRQAGSQLLVRASERGVLRHEVALPPEVAQLQTISAGPQHIIVVGWMNGALASQAVVLDRATGKLVDSFWGYGMSVSPNAQFIAFRKFFPAHGVDAIDAQYRIYDVSRGAAENRVPLRAVSPGDPGLDSRVDVGTPIYPLTPGELDQDPMATSPSLLHRPGSSFTWADGSNGVAFVDVKGNTASLIYTKVPVMSASSATTFVAGLNEMGSICSPSIRSGSCQSISPDHVVLKANGARIDVSWRNTDDATQKFKSVVISDLKSAPR